MLDLFADAEPWHEPLAPGATILRRFALSRAAALFDGIDAVTACSPFRHMVTPGGYTMSVAMTNCGELGWATNERGYVYAANDPLTDQPWPPMPEAFQALCHDAAVAAAILIFDPMPVLSTAMPLGQSSPCIRIRTSRTCARRSSRYPLGCPLSFSLAACGATTRSNG